MPHHEHPDLSAHHELNHDDQQQGLLTRLLHSRVLLISAATVAILAVAGSTLGYASLGTSVTVSVDGEEREVSASGDTVGDVLDSEGIDVGEHDVVAPDLDESIEDGTLISVQYGRQIDLTVDGKTTTHWVTGTDVQSALDEIGATYDNARLSSSRGLTVPRGGLDLQVVTPKTVKLALAGRKPVKRTVAALTAADAVRAEGVKVDRHDRFKVGKDTGKSGRKHEIQDGDKIVFTDVRVAKKKVAGETVERDVVEQDDDSMATGETEVVTEGRDGSRNVTYKLTFVNGKLDQRTAVKQKVVRAPVDRVVKVGTKEPEPAPSSGPNFAPGNTVWDRLAQCESGGNWAINTGNGYYGGLQFNLGTWRSYGGSGLPSNNSRETQIAIATKVRNASGGYGAWPGCAASLGLPR